MGMVYEKAFGFSSWGFAEIEEGGSLLIGAKLSELLITEEALESELGVAYPTFL